MVAEVIGIDSINNPCPPCRRGDRRQQAVQLPLTRVAAILRIAGIGGIGQLRGGDFPVANAKPAGLDTGFLTQVGRQCRGNPCDCQGLLPTLLHGNGRHKGAVHPTGVGHHHRVQGGKLATQLLQGPTQGRGQRFQESEVHRGLNPDLILPGPTQQRR